MTEDEIILTHLLQCRSIDLATSKPVLNSSQLKLMQEYKRRRLAGEPLQYILGTANFMGLELAVNPSVLVPRPETEQLVDHALKYFKGGLALDLGTGSGNIAIALAYFVPNCQIVTVEISPQALKLARSNAQRHGVEDRIEFIQEDMQLFLEKNRDAKKFDFIISNPPYIPTSQLDRLPKDVQQEPTSALDGGADGLNFYRFIIKYSPCLLRTEACLMMEFGDGQAEAIKGLYESPGHFLNIQIFKDLAGRERIINGQIHH